jgi:hypothetical protein
MPRPSDEQVAAALTRPETARDIALAKLTDTDRRALGLG